MNSASPTSIACWKEVVTEFGPALASAIEDCSLGMDVDPRDLRKQLLLHLPRFEFSELFRDTILGDEVLRIGRKLADLQHGYHSWSNRPRIPFLDKRRVDVRPCAPNIAQEIYRRFHYIGSGRNGLVNLGAYSQDFPDIPFAIAALSEMDIAQLETTFPRLQRRSVLVLSRVFAFNWAPKNSISFLLGAVRQWVRQNSPQVRTLITYVNPNLEFTGGSYMSANWRLLVETPTQYLYLHNDYITYRTFLQLDPRMQSETKHSLYELEPLRLLSYSLKDRDDRDA